MQECASCPPERYSGDEIDHVEITGALSVLQTVDLCLKNGKSIRMSAEMLVCPQRIVPHIRASRGSWGRISNQPVHTDQAGEALLDEPDQQSPLGG